jgi:branched-subunit amino acid ABC-type transport system permease component
MLTSAVIAGLGLGSMYGLLALGFHVTYAVSNTVNFAQGGTMMMGAVLAFPSRFWLAHSGASSSSASLCARLCDAGRTPG